MHLGVSFRNSCQYNRFRLAIPESCPAGTEFYIAGKCLWPVNNRENFSAAQEECGLSGGVLVDVQDQETNEAVKSIIKEK